MNVIINGRPRSVQASTLEGLAQELSLPSHGVAIALGARMVQREEWGTTRLTEGCELIIVKATFGG